MPSQSTIQNLLWGHNIPLGLDIVPMAIVFILSGYFFQLLFQNKKLQYHPFISIVIILFFLFITIKISLMNNTNYVLMAENRYGDLFNFFIVTFAGIIMCILITLLIDKYTKHFSNLMQKIGCDTMTIFILHKYPLQIINELILLIPISHISNYLIIPIYLLFTLIICTPISSLIKKHAPILTGK